MLLGQLHLLGNATFLAQTNKMDINTSGGQHGEHRTRDEIYVKFLALVDGYLGTAHLTEKPRRY